MTWLKTGAEFPRDCALAGLSSDAYRTHHEGLTWVMERETDGFVATSDVKRFAEVDEPPEAIKELVACGFWVTTDGGWQIVHSMENQPTREELAAKRAKDAERQARRRRREAGLDGDGPRGVTP